MPRGISWGGGLGQRGCGWAGTVRLLKVDDCVDKLRYAA